MDYFLLQRLVTLVPGKRQLLQLTWQTEYLHPLAKVAKHACKQADIKWADKETQATAEATNNGNTSCVWELAKKKLKRNKKQPKRALAPILDENRQVISDHAQLQQLWIQQFVH